MVHRTTLALLVAGSVLGLLPGRAVAGSDLRLVPFAPFGTIPAETYDEHTGRRLGDADVGLTELPNGNLLLVGFGAIDGEALIQVASELERTEDGAALRPVWEESRSWRKGGVSQGRMWIDHHAGFAVCTPAEDSDEKVVRVELPAHERVANVPMNLLLEPLATGEQREIDFQFLACRAARVVDATARVAHPDAASPGPIEVRSELDLGWLTPLARGFLPHFSFWFDPTRAGAWVAHRMPIFTGGPEVLIVRHGVPLRPFLTP
ncbi:MAG TPA: hypothetical protein VMW35_00350 [Myxococcota bacterium]|jgi:hypothetical protein|nr:hypothetical protein [Myxococcota bacterium]